MSRHISATIASILILSITTLSHPTPTLSGEVTEKSNITVSASVPQTSTPGDTTPPSTPILISPPDNTYTNNPNITFIWKPSSDDNSNTITYTLFINNEPEYQDISGTSNAITSRYSTIISQDTISLSQLKEMNDGTYSWFVQAQDPSSNKSTSATFHFTLDTVPPHFIITKIDRYDTFISSSNPSTLSENQSFTTNNTNILFTLNTEPNSTIQAVFRSLTTNKQTTTQHTPTKDTLSFYTTLKPDTYTVTFSSFDKAGNTASIPPITLNITQKSTILKTFEFINPKYLPTPTLANITDNTRYVVAMNYAILIAVSIMILIIYLKKRWNIKIHNNTPYPTTILIQHDNRQYQTKLDVNQQTALFIRHLKPKSTLTITTNNQYTTILCILRTQQKLTITTITP